MNIKVVKTFLIWVVVFILVNLAIQIVLEILLYPFFGENYMPADIVSIIPGLALAWIIGSKVAKDLSSVPGIAKTFGSSFWIGFHVVLIATLLTAGIDFLFSGELHFTGFVLWLAGGYGAKGIKLRD